METININMTPNCHEVETIHASQNDTSLRKWGIRPYDYDGNDVTNQQDKATLVDIKGQTLKWNQLQPNNISRTNNGVTYTYDNGKLTVNGTATSTSWWLYGGLPTMSMKANHKYLFVFGKGMEGASLTTFNWYLPNSGQRFYTDGIITINSDTDQYIQLQVSAGYTIDTVLYPQVFDLTQMFGSGNEPTSVEEFRNLFPLDYYPFNSGSLIPFNGNGIKTVGFNQWDEEWELGAISSSGEPYSSNSSIRGKHLYKCFGGKQYYCNGNYGVYWYDSSQKFISVNYVNNAVITSPTNAQYFRIGFFSSYGTTYNNDACISFSSSRNGEYEPYTESVLNLPISTYFPSGMKSIEPNQYTTVEITDELIPTKATTRVGSITIDGNTPMNPNGATSEFSAFIMPISGKANGTANIMSDLFEVGSGKAYRAYGRAGNNSVEFSLPPSVPQTVADAHAWFAQHPTTLYFELATPIETAISPELDLTFNIDKGGTEELLPSSLMNGSVDLGSLTWTLYGANNHEFTAELPNMKVGTTNASIPSLGVNAVGNYAQWTAQRPNDSLYKDSNGKLHLRLNPYTTVAELTSALQGVYLWYETTDSTPTTTPLNATVKYQAETKDVYFTYQVSDFLSTIFKFYLVTKGIQIPCELEDDTLVADCTSEISNEPGFFDCKIKAENDLGQIFSNKFQLHIERSPQ